MGIWVFASCYWQIMTADQQSSDELSSLHILYDRTHTQDEHVLFHLFILRWINTTWRMQKMNKYSSWVQVVEWSSTGMQDNRRCDPLNKASNTMASDQTANSNCPKQTCWTAAPHNTTRHSETTGTIYTSAIAGLTSTSKINQRYWFSNDKANSPVPLNKYYQCIRVLYCFIASVRHTVVQWPKYSLQHHIVINLPLKKAPD